MVGATFTPGAPATSIADSLDSGFNTGVSFSQRKRQIAIQEQQSEIQKAQEQRAAAEYAVMQPVRQAQAQADIAQAHATLTGAIQAEGMRAEAMKLAPVARQDFDNLLHIQDPEERASAGLDWIGRYGQLDNIKGLDQEFGTKKEIIAKMHAESLALTHLKATTEAQKQLIQAKGQVAVNVASIRTDKATKVERYQRLKQQAIDDGDTDSAQLYDSLLQKESAAHYNTVQSDEELLQHVKDAEAAGDPEEIKFWQDRAKARNIRGVGKSGIDFSSPAAQSLFGTPAAAPGTPAAKPAATTAPAAATSISNLNF